MSKIVRLDIVDDGLDYSNRVMATFYLVNPDESKLMRLKDMVENRFIKWELEEFAEIYDYVKANFETVEIETKEIKW